jgi:MFS family permease
VIGIGTASFYVTVFLGSTVIARLTGRWGNQRITAVGAILLALYPLLMAISWTPWMLVVTSLVGGAAWSLVGVASINYLLERLPANDRPAHLAWYNLVLNIAILIGSLAGPTIAGMIGYFPALIIFGIGRFIVGLGILRWG